MSSVIARAEVGVHTISESPGDPLGARFERHPCASSRVGFGQRLCTRPFRRSLAAPTLALVKLRGGATDRQVGAVVKSRPNRIKELKDPKLQDDRVNALFEVLEPYGGRLAVVFKDGH